MTLGDTPNDRKDIATYQFGGTPLGKITALQFSAYSHSGVAGANESPYLVMNVDFESTALQFIQKNLRHVVAFFRHHLKAGLEAKFVVDLIGSGLDGYIVDAESDADSPANDWNQPTLPNNQTDTLASLANRFCDTIKIAGRNKNPEFLRGQEMPLHGSSLPRR